MARLISYIQNGGPMMMIMFKRITIQLLIVQNRTENLLVVSYDTREASSDSIDMECMVMMVTAGWYKYVAWSSSMLRRIMQENKINDVTHQPVLPALKLTPRL